MRVTPESAGWRYLDSRSNRIAAGVAPAARARRPRDLRHRAGWQLRHPLRGRGLDRCWRSRNTVRRRAGGRVPAAGRHVRDLGAGGRGRGRARSCAGERGAAARVIRSADARLEIRGAGRRSGGSITSSWTDAAAESLLVTEVPRRGGHWSSYPPHKHRHGRSTARDRAGGDLLPPSP